MRNYYNPNTRTYGPKKVKHVHFIQSFEIISLERDVNAFADEHPEYKILGIKLTPCNVHATAHEDQFVATITYLCDAPGEFDNYEHYTESDIYTGEDEEE